MSVTCRVCGRVNADGAQFCANPNCGEYLGWQAGPPDAPPGGWPAGPAGQGAGGGPYTGRFPVSGGGPPSGGGGLPPGGPPPGGPPPPGGAGPAGDGGQRASIRVTLADPVVDVTPGATGSTTLSIYNAGTQVEGLTIRLEGPAASWTVVEPPELSVYPEQTGTVTLRFAPPRAASCPAGHAWYVMRVDSTVHLGLSVTANGVAAVAAYHEVAAELVPPTATGRGATRHQVVIDNRGNVVERAQLGATDDEGAFRMELGRASVELPPGKVGVPLTVRAPWRWFGRPRTVPIHATVAVQGSSAPLRADGTRHVTPVFHSWVPLVALGTLLLLGGGGVALALASGGGNGSGNGTGTASPTQILTTSPPKPTPTMPSPTGGPTATPTTAKPTTPPPTTTPPVDPLDKIVPADCLPYDPARLKIYDAGAIGWRLAETLPSGQEHWMLILDNQADATAALAVARRSTNFCFIGRDNTRPNRVDYIVEYWKGSSGQTPAIPSPDCIPYNKAGLNIVNEGATGWLLTDGASRMLILDDEQDARNALILARAHSRQCFIGRDNTRPNRRDYIAGYWLP